MNCTILGVDWLVEVRQEGRPQRPSGNQSFTGVPRQVLVVGQLNREEWVVGVSKANDSAALTGWIYGLEGKDIGTGANGKTLTPRKIVWKRQATPAEVLNARQQAEIEEDPNVKELLQFMSTGGKFKTDDLVNWLNNVRLIGKNKGRKLLTSLRGRRLLEAGQQRPSR